MTKLSVAFKKMEVSKQVYDDYVNYVLNNGEPTNWTELERLAKIANDAEREWREAKDQALNECSCRPDSVNNCPVCMAASAERYQDSIPFEGGGL